MGGMGYYCGRWVVIMCPIHSFWSVDGAKFVGRKVLEHSFICDCGSYTRTERPVGVDESVIRTRNGTGRDDGARGGGGGKRVISFMYTDE